MPDDDEPTGAFDRLGALAPEVDVDLAMGVFSRVRRHRARRRQALTGLGAVVIVLVVAAAVFAIGRGDGTGDTEQVAAGLPPTTAELKVPAPFSGRSDDGVVVTVSFRAPLVVGTTVPLDVTVTNGGPMTVTWESGGCGELVHVLVLDPGQQPDETDPVGQPFAPWDGDPMSIPASVRVEGVPAAGALRAGQSSTPTPGGQACTADLRFSSIEPGASEARRILLDLRTGPGDLSARDLLATFGYTVGDDDPAGPTERVEARTQIVPVDDARRSDTLDDALAAFSTNPFVGDWASENADGPGSPDVLGPSMGPKPGALVRWVDGSWELWLMPDPVSVGNGRLLRARWDVERREVVDVRTVLDYQATADDSLADPVLRDTNAASVLFHQD